MHRIWSVVDNWGSIVRGGPVPVDGSRGLLSFLCFPLDVYELNKLLAIPLYGSVIWI